jgi:hypothetical protein
MPLPSQLQLCDLRKGDVVIDDQYCVLAGTDVGALKWSFGEEQEAAAGWVNPYAASSTLAVTFGSVSETGSRKKGWGIQLRGFIFTEFIEFVETKHGLDVVDEMITGAKSSCGGAYVAVDTYSLAEFASLLGSLSRILEAEPTNLLRTFGQNLFASLAARYKHLLKDMDDPFILLERLDGYVHFEVQKLEPEAELPTFDFETTGTNSATMTYRWERALSDFAEGLLLGCFEYFDNPLSLSKKDVSDGEGKVVVFTVVRSIHP